MFIQSKVETAFGHNNGVAIRSRLGGREILVQWSNGRQRWCQSDDIVGAVRFVELEKTRDYDVEDLDFGQPDLSHGGN